MGEEGGTFTADSLMPAQHQEGGNYTGNGGPCLLGLEFTSGSTDKTQSSLPAQHQDQPRAVTGFHGLMGRGFSFCHPAPTPQICSSLP